MDTQEQKTGAYMSPNEYKPKTSVFPVNAVAWVNYPKDDGSVAQYPCFATKEEAVNYGSNTIDISGATSEDNTGSQ